jgi:hypothetical protein
MSEETAPLASSEVVGVRLPEFVRQIALVAAWEVIKEHVENCPIKDVQEKVDKLELRVATIIGLMFGSGVLGGTAVAAVLKLAGG